MAQIDLSRFCRSMEVMLNSGLPLHEGLAILESGSTGEEKWVYSDLILAIESGRTLSSGLRKHPKHFPVLVGACVRAAERAGRIHRVFGVMADLLERLEKLKGQMRAALMYPGILLALTLVIVIFIARFVLPREREFLESLGAELPLFSRVLISVAQVLTHPLTIVALVGGVGVLNYCLRIGKFPMWSLQRDQFLLKVPGLGPIIQRASALVLLSGTGIQMDAGITLVPALKNMLPAVQNAYLRDKLAVAIQEISQGEPPSEALKRWEILPTVPLSLLRIAEEEGRWARACTQGAELLEYELNHTLQSLAAMLEPVALVVMALVVGFVVISTALPTAQLIQNL